MSLITDAKAFMDKLLHRRDERVCPPSLWLDPGQEERSRRHTLRGLGGVRLAAEESDEEIERACDLAAKAGLNLEQIRVFTSGGAAGFREFLARCLHGVRHQRCVFHLWRNVLPIITHYAAVAGEQWAEGLKKGIACVWNATTRAEAELMLKLLVGVYGAEPIAQEAVRLVEETFERLHEHGRL